MGQFSKTVWGFVGSILFGSPRAFTGFLWIPFHFATCFATLFDFATDIYSGWSLLKTGRRSFGIASLGIVGLSAKLRTLPQWPEMHPENKNISFQNWVCQLWKSVMDLVAYFCTYLKAPSCHNVKLKNLNMFDSELFFIIFLIIDIFDVLPMHGPWPMK